MGNHAFILQWISLEIEIVYYRLQFAHFVDMIM